MLFLQEPLRLQESSSLNIKEEYKVNMSLVPFKGRILTLMLMVFFYSRASIDNIFSQQDVFPQCMMHRVVEPSRACIKRLITMFSEYHIELVVNEIYSEVSTMQIFDYQLWVHLTSFGLVCFRVFISSNQRDVQETHFVQVYWWYSLQVSFQIFLAFILQVTV